MSYPRLSPATLPFAKPALVLPGYQRDASEMGIVHIGPGAFHRAHQAYYADELLKTDLRWAISAIALRTANVRDALAPQDGLYVLSELGTQMQLRAIGAIREVLVASEQSETAFARLTAASTRMVTMTVTEKGYCLNAQSQLDESHVDIVHDRQNAHAPRSVVGWLAESLHRRRAAGLAPFTVVSCDNLADNGATLRRAVVAFAQGRDKDLARWIESEVVFPRTMVDSITPATDDALRTRVAEAAGLEDAWPVQREPFTQWVIEDLPAMRTADWESVGVTLATDVSVYDRAKLRLLNGAHSTLAYLGSLRNHDTVFAAIGDADLAHFVEKMMREDLAASLGSPRGFDVQGYIGAVLGRFRNPGIRHLLSQIAWDGSKKLPVRITSTIAESLQAGRSVRRLVVPLAAWMRFVIRQAKAGIAIVDPEADRLAQIGQQCTGDAAADIARFAGLHAIFPPSLTANADFATALRAAYLALSDPGRWQE